MTMMDDLVFGHVMAFNKEYVTNLISNITNIPLEDLSDIRYADTNLKEDNRSYKHQRSDIIIETKDTIYKLEMNKNPPHEYLVKNISYLFNIHNQNNKRSEKYNMGRRYVQINFDYYGEVGTKLINKYTFKEDVRNDKYPIELEIYHIKLDYLQNIKYTKSVNNNFLKYLKIMVLDDEKKLKEISKGDEILENVVRDMLHYEAMDVPFGYRDIEEEDRWMRNSLRDRYKEEGLAEGRAEGRAEGIVQGKAEGRAEGIEQEKIKTALTMLKLRLDKNTIIKVTGLSLEQINNLQN